MAAHETFSRSNDEAKGSSDRAFGLVFAGFFTLTALAPLRRHEPPRLWGIGLAIAFLLVALARPGTLRPLNRLWTKLALLLQKITNPIVMAVLFYLLITPVALLLRLLGKDPMNRRLDPNAPTYWVKRDPAGPAPDSMQHQF